MTQDEIKTQSFNKMQSALNEVFPGISFKLVNNTIKFDNVQVEMDGNDNYGGYFNVSVDGILSASLWSIKDTIPVILQEVFRSRKQKILKELR
jgi:hypothetical protein